MKDFLNKNIKTIIILFFIIALSIVGITLALQLDSTSVTIAAGDYDVVYSGTTTLPSSKLQPIYDADLLSTDNASKVMKVTFTVKGAQTNPTDIPIIYDVSLTNLNLPEELKSEYLKWRLYKNNTQISEGSFSTDFDAQVNKRMVLTTIQQDLPSYSSTADSYTFYVWISETCTGDITTCTDTTLDLTPLTNKTFTGEIRIELSVKGKKTLERPQTATNSIMTLASTGKDGACAAGGVGICATNSYTAADGTTKYHDYRYRGGEGVNNFVSFNNDLYRIIGVFDENSHGVKGKYLMKLISANIINDASWGAYNTTATSGTYSDYSSDWTGNTVGVPANLNILLNEYFYTKNSTSSTYGACSDWTYYNNNTNYRTNDCTNIIGYGINSSLQSYIQEATWYLYGDIDVLSKQDFYLCERGQKSGCIGGNSGANDTSTIAKIGLMYPSDYLYASAYYADTSTTTGSSSYYGNKNWLYQGYEWLITPQTHGSAHAFHVHQYGYVSYNPSTGGLGVRPTFYLKSSVYVTGGEGTFDNPYTISM